MRLVAAAVVVAAAAAFDGRLSAVQQCSPGSVCAEYDAAGLVFVGRVTQVLPAAEDRQLGLLLHETVTFDVIEDFKTTAGVATMLELDPAAAGARLFSEGETVLVYARRTSHPDLWFAGCSRTRRVSPEDLELVTLRQLAARVNGASLEGSLEVSANPRPPAPPRNVDLANLQLTAQAMDGTGTVTISTQPGGYFLFPWLKPGTYRIRFDSPLYARYVRDVTIGERSRCQNLDPITVRPR